MGQLSSIFCSSGYGKLIGTLFFILHLNKENYNILFWTMYSERGYLVT